MTDRTAPSFSALAADPTFRTIDGVSIRFVESDRRDADALLFSPWPESVFAYEPMWSRLAETAHLVAVDLPGFGRSERKDALMTPLRWAISSCAWPTNFNSVSRTSLRRTSAHPPRCSPLPHILIVPEPGRRHWRCGRSD